jgi:zinc transport system permease protein
MDDFLLRALLTGLLVALMAGPLGTFVIWRRMAYFGDALSHSALLGIVIGVAFGINITVAVIVLCFVLAVSLLGLKFRTRMHEDALLGILAHGSLALGLVAWGLFDGVRLDLFGYLFGDILTVTWEETLMVAGLATLVLLTLVVIWVPLLQISIDESLARVEGVAVRRTQLIYVMLMAALVAVAIKLVGILMTTALMIIPASAARGFARTPGQMAVFAAVAGMLSVVLGIALAVMTDVAAGPAIVLVSMALFLATLLVRR